MTRSPALVVVALCLATVTSLHAQEQQVREALQRTIAAWNGGDANALCGQFMPNSRGFYLDALLLNEGGCDAQQLQAAFAAGLKPSVVMRHVTTQIHGGTVTTAAYFEGIVTNPGGVIVAGPWRYTETRVRDGNSWKIVQWHFSRLDTAR